MPDVTESDWIDWAGGVEAPIAFEDILAIRHRDGEVSWARQYARGALSLLDWTHDGQDGDVVAYLPVGQVS